MHAAKNTLANAGISGSGITALGLQIAAEKKVASARTLTAKRNKND